MTDRVCEISHKVGGTDKPPRDEFKRIIETEIARVGKGCGLEHFSGAWKFTELAEGMQIKFFYCNIAQVTTGYSVWPSEREWLKNCDVIQMAKFVDLTI
jgi:hypothetical protein